jgi:hypothetical protein
MIKPTLNAMKWRCGDLRCGWHGREDKVLKAPDPFTEGEELWACPDCKEVNGIIMACDEPRCWKEATCGTPTPAGYRHTCGQHRPE